MGLSMKQTIQLFGGAPMTSCEPPFDLNNQYVETATRQWILSTWIFRLKCYSKMEQLFQRRPSGSVLDNESQISNNPISLAGSDFLRLIAQK